ncbi:hypothetical protein CALVIDRAFT_556124 [Calocera viscosa TUFC12733]|uniref:HMG box domain-containing protein n=1 Tax=Calocera viscosa (strain TUFC12733) TaxID=1330018 RepID=A0A167KRI3_CALVF|nr:hypothetical protein CALVIDRAFT_556124 [Calocera viscosa TUFC12733]
MPPKAAVKQQNEGKDEVVSAFTQLASALNNAARIVETYTSALSKGGLSVQAAGEGYAAALLALGGGTGIKQEAVAVAGKKRGRPSAATDELEPGKRKRRMKKEKDPLAPKRPASAYLLYQNDKRAEFVEKFKDIPYHEMLSKISESWGKLTDTEKQPYTAAQAKLKADYEGRKKAYEVSKIVPVAAPEVEEEEEEEVDEDELDASPVAPVKATNGEAESEDDEDSDEESDEAEQVASIVAKTKGVNDDDEEEDSDDDSDDDDSESSEDVEPPRKKAKGAVPTSTTKKTPAKVAAKPASKKAAAPAPVKEKKTRKAKD